MGPDPVGTGMDKPCVYTGPGGSDTDRICYLVPNGPTYEGDPIWNCTTYKGDPIWNCTVRFRTGPV